MFWRAWLASHQQRHPHLSWHLCGPAKSSAQQDLGTQIIDDPVFFRAKYFHRQSTMPPLECANFLEYENKTVCVAPLRPSPWIQHQFFPSYTRKLSHFTLLSFFFLMFGHFWPKWPGMNAIVCETTDVSRETATLPIFQKTWFQAILAKKKNEKKKKRKKEKITEYEDFMECEDLAECVDFTVCVRP